MSSESDARNIIIPQGKVPPAAYQAIYYKLTQKTEKLREIFDEAYEVNVDNIVQLDAMVLQTVRQFNPEQYNSNCTISFFRDEALEFSSIDQFRSINFLSRKATQYVEYAFDFYTIRPVEINDVDDIAQRFRVVVKIDQDIVEEDTDGVPFFMKGMIYGRNIRLIVEYSDYAIGRTLQVCVQDWIKTLPYQKVPKIINTLESKSDFFGMCVPLLFLSASLLGMSKFKVEWINNSANSILKSISISILMYIFGRFLISRFYRQLSMGKPITFIKITNGDIDRYRTVSRSRKAKLNMAIVFATTIFLGIVCNICSYFILKQFQ